MQEKDFRVSVVTKHDGNQVPNGRMELAKLTIKCFVRGLTVVTSQVLVPSQAVKKGQAVSDLDADLVVAKALEVVVDRPLHVLLHIALDTAALRGRILWERPLDYARLRLRRLATRLSTQTWEA